MHFQSSEILQRPLWLLVITLESLSQRSFLWLASCFSISTQTPIYRFSCMNTHRHPVNTSIIMAYHPTSTFYVIPGTGQFNRSYVAPFLQSIDNTVPFWALASTYSFVSKLSFLHIVNTDRLPLSRQTMRLTSPPWEDLSHVPTTTSPIIFRFRKFRPVF